MESVSVRRIVMGMAVAAALLLTAGALLRPPARSGLPQTPAEVSLTVEPPEGPEGPEPTAPPAPYRLGVWQGRVAVFEGEGVQPATVLDTPVTALPIPDQQSLEAGIPVYSREELAGFLEDYGS